MITLEDNDGVVTLWLDDAGRRNALLPGDLRQIEARASDEALAERPLVLAGRGPVFCAGFDLKACQKDSGLLPDLLRALSGAIVALRARSAPVVAAAHGAAIAGGCALLGGADYVVADRAAKLGYPVARLGLSPAVSAPFLRCCVPPGEARRLMLDPALIAGTEAHRIGLVHELVDAPEQVHAAALRAARLLGAKPRWAFTATKQWVRELDDASESRAELALAVSLATAEDAGCRAALKALPL